MSYTNETTYYGLPLPTGSDKSTFTDNNTAFQAVDAALHTASEGVAQAAEDITSLTGRVGDCETNISNITTDLGLEKAKIVNLQNKETLQDGEIRDVRSDCEDMISAYNEATSTSTHAYSAGDYFIYNDVLYVATDSIAVGDTIVPDTNCETTNVTTELKSQAGDIAQLNSDLTGLVVDVSNNFSFGAVFTSMGCKANIINDTILVIHLDGYKSGAGLPVSDNEHFCTCNNATLLSRMSGDHPAMAWAEGSNPHLIRIAKDSNGLAYTEKTSAFNYMSADLVFILADSSNS